MTIATGEVRGLAIKGFKYMGLDLVELVVAFEQHFGIEIPNADAAELWTTRDVIDYLTPRLVRKRSAREQR